MEILNVGPLEFLFILIIALIVLGPENMIKGARSIGKFISQVVRSPMWAQMMSASKEIRELPTKMVQEAGLDETMKELEKDVSDISSEVNKEMEEARKEVERSVQEASISTSIPKIGAETVQEKPEDHPAEESEPSIEPVEITSPEDADVSAAPEASDESNPLEMEIDTKPTEEGLVSDVQGIPTESESLVLDVDAHSINENGKEHITEDQTMVEGTEQQPEMPEVEVENQEQAGKDIVSEQKSDGNDRVKEENDPEKESQNP